MKHAFIALLLLLAALAFSASSPHQASAHGPGALIGESGAAVVSVDGTLVAIQDQQIQTTSVAVPYSGLSREVVGGFTSFYADHVSPAPIVRSYDGSAAGGTPGLLNTDLMALEHVLKDRISWGNIGRIDRVSQTQTILGFSYSPFDRSRDSSITSFDIISAGIGLNTRIRDWQSAQSMNRRSLSIAFSEVIPHQRSPYRLRSEFMAHPFHLTRNTVGA